MGRIRGRHHQRDRGAPRQGAATAMQACDEAVAHGRLQPVKGPAHDTSQAHGGGFDDSNPGFQTLRFARRTGRTCSLLLPGNAPSAADGPAARISLRDDDRQVGGHRVRRSVPPSSRSFWCETVTMTGGGSPLKRVRAARGAVGERLAALLPGTAFALVVALAAAFRLGHAWRAGGSVRPAHRHGFQLPRRRSLLCARARLRIAHRAAGWWCHARRAHHA